MEQGARSGAPLNTSTGQPTKIQAIPTRYKGYHFRSRLEARFAVFFDALGFAWEYEPEGYDLGELGYYLPDFRVWSAGEVGKGAPHWIEVKGVFPEQREIDLITELFWQSRTSGAIVYGQIECHRIVKWPNNRPHSEEYPYHSRWGIPAWVVLQGHTPDSWGFYRPYDIEGNGDYDSKTDSYTYFDNKCRLGIWHNERLGATVPEAVAAARSARFEHGHSGAS